MYLIKVQLDKKNPVILHALADCQKMHRFITGLFGTDRQSSRILYRTNVTRDKVDIYLYSQRPVKEDIRFPVIQKEISSWLDSMAEGQVWSFDLIASPSKKLSAEGKRNSQRRGLRRPEERQDWLERKAVQSGFQILYAAEQEHIQSSGWHAAEKGGIMYHNGYRYQGTLRITDADIFRKSLQDGIGSGKAYGFGLMMVKPR